ncbi:MAG: dienelactone hydrolase family protein, partial [Candidatus Poribacteria bacterium]|nr:dienelactone hydrolase family protein [Candidatus Poribacteria bacterium]
EYTVDGVVFKGFLAYDDQVEGKRPGVLVVHEWWGHNEYVRNRARMLAELGYTALAVDMYGDGKLADHPEDAGKFARAVTENIEVAKARFMAGMDLLKKHPTVDSEHIAAIGYCFGGGIVLHMARLGVDELDGVVSFHGSLSTQSPAKRGTVKTKILVCHGAIDPFIAPEQVGAFKKEMLDAEVDLKFISYPEATHSFTNPEADKRGGPLRYNAAADKQSWIDMQEFFKTLFVMQ